MKTTFCLYIFLIIAISFGIASNTTLQLPLTINPLLQDWVRMGHFSKLLLDSDSSYYSQVSFSDIVNTIGLIPRVEGNKSIEALVILAAAAKADGLTPQAFEFVQPSKWSINMSEQDFANVSAQFTIPVNDTTSLLDIQEKMFKVLENKFEFSTDEIAQGLNKSKAEIHCALEPGWINIVHFITEKNILRLEKNYTIPSFYIAQALNMFQAELYNSTLPQLEDILKNKLHIIKEAAERLRLYTSTAGFTTVVSSTFLMLNTSSATNSTISKTIINKTTPLTQETSYIQMIVSNGTMGNTPSPLPATPLISSILNSTTKMSITKTALAQSTTFTENPGISLSSELSMSNTTVSPFLNNTWSPSMPVSLAPKQSTLVSTLQVKPLPTNNHTTLSMQATTYSLDYRSIVSAPFSSSDANGNASMFTRTTSKSMQRSSSYYVNENTTIQISTSAKVQVTAKSSSQISNYSKANSTSQMSELETTQLKTTTNFLKASFAVPNISSFAIAATSALWKSSTATLWSSKTSLKNKLTNTLSKTVLMWSSSKHEPGIVPSRSKQETQLSTATKYTVVTEPWKPATSVSTEPLKPTTAITTAPTSVYEGATEKRTDDEFDPVMFVVVPVAALLVLVAFTAGVIVCWKHRHRSLRGIHKNVETGSELSTTNLTESLENLNRNRTKDFSNPGAEDKSSRSMSRASSMSNLETIQEANEPAEPEIYDL